MNYALVQGLTQGFNTGLDTYSRVAKIRKERENEEAIQKGITMAEDARNADMRSIAGAEVAPTVNAEIEARTKQAVDAENQQRLAQQQPAPESPEANNYTGVVARDQQGNAVNAFNNMDEAKQFMSTPAAQGLTLDGGKTLSTENAVQQGSKLEQDLKAKVAREYANDPEFLALQKDAMSRARGKVGSSEDYVEKVALPYYMNYYLSKGDTKNAAGIRDWMDKAENKKEAAYSNKMLSLFTMGDYEGAANLYMQRVNAQAGEGDSKITKMVPVFGNDNKFSGYRMTMTGSGEQGEKEVAINATATQMALVGTQGIFSYIRDQEKINQQANIDAQKAVMVAQSQYKLEELKQQGADDRAIAREKAKVRDEDIKFLKTESVRYRNVLRNIDERVKNISANWDKKSGTKVYARTLPDYPHDADSATKVKFENRFVANFDAAREQDKLRKYLIENDRDAEFIKMYEDLSKLYGNKAFDAAKR